eukprot:TRINITY_DN225_c1_g1_i1.p1 TRINITY_DN225_c1_g1~~TRINITY_DN225_c1_g1_i1.p1  ORF type:complete len:226 (-),score=61.74 TRINITY_DN225_c1_g1_i1:46-672(-)
MRAFSLPPSLTHSPRPALPLPLTQRPSLSPSPSPSFSLYPPPSLSLPHPPRSSVSALSCRSFHASPLLSSISFREEEEEEEEEEVVGEDKPLPKAFTSKPPPPLPQPELIECSSISSSVGNLVTVQGWLTARDGGGGGGDGGERYVIRDDTGEVDVVTSPFTKLRWQTPEDPKAEVEIGTVVEALGIAAEGSDGTARVEALQIKIPVK